MKYDDLLLNILLLAKYPEDPTEFIKKIHGLALNTATISLIQGLSQSQVDEFLKENANIDYSKPEIVDKLIQFFTKDKVDRILNESYGELINEFIQEVTPNLDPETQIKIANLIETYLPSEAA